MAGQARSLWQLRAVRTILPYALVLAVAAALVQWLEYRHDMRAFSNEIFVALLAAGFTVLGIWVGVKLTPRHARGEFVRNEAALRALGISPRECEILELLAQGISNREMAERLHISPNTVKTHVARLYEKLAVEKRMQAVEKARLLALIPAQSG